MIRHIVLTSFKPETAEAEIAAIYRGLSLVVERLPGARGFTAGRSTSPEQKEQGFLHAFVIDFDGWDDLARYAEDPEHKALGGRLREHAIGGGEGIIVLDLEV